MSRLDWLTAWLPGLRGTGETIRLPISALLLLLPILKRVRNKYLWSSALLRRRLPQSSSRRRRSFPLSIQIQSPGCSGRTNLICEYNTTLLSMHGQGAIDGYFPWNKFRDLKIRWRNVLLLAAAATTAISCIGIRTFAVAGTDRFLAQGHVGVHSTRTTEFKREPEPSLRVWWKTVTRRRDIRESFWQKWEAGEVRFWQQWEASLLHWGYGGGFVMRGKMVSLLIQLIVIPNRC